MKEKQCIKAVFSRHEVILYLNGCCCKTKAAKKITQGQKNSLLVKKKKKKALAIIRSKAEQTLNLKKKREKQDANKGIRKKMEWTSVVWGWDPVCQFGGFPIWGVAMAT